MTKTALTIACLIGFAPLAQAQATAPDPWTEVRFLVGDWRGSFTSEEGKGTVTKSFRLLLSGRFLQEKSRYDFPPQLNYPNGSVMAHASVLAQDKPHRLVLYRQHHEDHLKGVFPLVKSQSTSTKLVFESEPPADAPSPLKVRETWELAPPNAFVDIVEIAQDGQTFVVQSRISFQRRQP